MRKCADQGMKIDPAAAERVKTQMYVDDGVLLAINMKMENMMELSNKL